MTLSLKSKFDFAGRRAIFLSAHKLVVYQWHRGDIASSYMFDVNNEGKAYFERYLRETPNVPTYVLLDVFEEEFRRDTAPHVYGQDRQAIIERKKARLYRDTPYYHASIQGRETDGRKDDQVLISAITNPKLLTTWLPVLEEYKVPLAGIYSVPLLTQSMLKLLPEPAENNLIVSIQSVSGLRQTFIKDGHLRVSRLVQMPRYGTEAYAPYIREEVDKIRRYLNSVRLVPNDQSQGNTFNIYFLMTGELLAQLREEFSSMSQGGLRFVDLNDLMAASGSARQLTSPFSDQLFVHRLLRERPGNLYARPRERRYQSMRNMRIAMLTLSALMLTGSAGWAGYAAMLGLNHRQNTLSAKAKSEFYTTRYQIAREGLPRTPVEPADLKTAVEAIQTVGRYHADPLPLMRILSTGLNRFPDIRPGNFDWVASTDPNIKLGSTRNAASSQGVIGYSDVSGQGTDYDYYHIAVVDGELQPFDGNYRRAISLINEFAETLRAGQDVFDVSIMSLPLDVSSDASMQGNTRATVREAKFSLRIVMGVKI